MRAHGVSDDDLASLVLGAASSLADAPGPLSTAHDIGAALASGEAPLAQACVLYAVQAAALPSMTERALRGLLERAAARCAELAGPLPARGVPEAVVLLATMSAALAAVAEVPPDDARALRDRVHRLMIASPAAASHAAAAVLGQLAAAEGTCASQLMMDYISLARLQAAALGSAHSGYKGDAAPDAAGGAPLVEL
jgi:hypothetical protein